MSRYWDEEDGVYYDAPEEKEQLFHNCSESSDWSTCVKKIYFQDMEDAVLHQVISQNLSALTERETQLRAEFSSLLADLRRVQEQKRLLTGLQNNVKKKPLE